MEDRSLSINGHLILREPAHLSLPVREGEGPMLSHYFALSLAFCPCSTVNSAPHDGQRIVSPLCSGLMPEQANISMHITKMMEIVIACMRFMEISFSFS